MITVFPFRRTAGALALLLLAACQTASLPPEPVVEPRVVIDRNIVVEYETKFSKAEAVELAEQANIQLAKIYEQLPVRRTVHDIEYGPGKIVLQVADDPKFENEVIGRTDIADHRITLAVDHLRTKQGADVVTHELVHAAAGNPHNYSPVLAEGLAVLLTLRLSPKLEKTLITEESIHRFSNLVTRRTGGGYAFSSYLNEPTALYRFTALAASTRQALYINFASFVKYLTETYGMRDFLRIYYHGKWVEVTGKQAELVMADWRDRVGAPGS